MHSLSSSKIKSEKGEKKRNEIDGIECMYVVATMTDTNLIIVNTNQSNSIFFPVRNLKQLQNKRPTAQGKKAWKWIERTAATTN